MELLVISHCAPHDKVGTAGEKTHNFYLKEFSKQEDINVRIITVCKATDVKKLDLDEYGIKNEVLVESQSKSAVIKRKLLRAISLVFNSHDKYANFVSGERQKFFYQSLKKYKEEQYKPDVIILEFTQCILLADMVKQFYPDVPIIGSSHDVSYKGSYRIWQFEKNFIKKFFRKRQYSNLKIRETEAISKCDLIVPQNNNDIEIFKKEPLLQNKKYMRIVPYYDSYAGIERKSDGKTIIFYGSMGRNENYLSVQWFVENVFNKLNNNLHFVIIGGNPPELIKKYESDKIHVTGFVPLEDVKNYFATCLCMVVPLILGSGIKVKILEAFSGGVPVLTNEIGNEGIYAIDKEQYLHCETAQEYIDALNKVGNGEFDVEQLGINAKLFSKEQFGLEQSLMRYTEKIREMAQ